MERKCSCGGIDIGVGVMHEPYCELNDAGHICILEEHIITLKAKIHELEVELASITDFANIFAREFDVEEVTDARELKILLERLWKRAISMRKELMTPMYFKTLEMEKERDEARNLVTKLKVKNTELIRILGFQTKSNIINMVNRLEQEE